MLCLVVGCGGGTVYNQPGSESGGYYETAWIDPKVVLEDPWYSLLRSHRVDSFFVDASEASSMPANRSIRLVIKSYECLATVNLLNGQSKVVRPLLAKNLGPGFYKLTINVGELKKLKLPTDNYYLKADYCGSTVITDLGEI
jgi:hypothetical protein